MALYTISEKRALKKLGIPDFRYMTKDKIVQFMSMTPNMNPDVVRAAIDQFPEFKNMAIQMTDALKDMTYKAFDTNQESQKHFYDACNSMLKSLELQLEDKEIDATERQNIRDDMMQVVYWIGQKDSENKEFIKSIVKYGSIAVGSLALAALSALGNKIDIPFKGLLKKSSDNDSELCENDKEDLL